MLSSVAVEVRTKGCSHVNTNTLTYKKHKLLVKLILIKAVLPHYTDISIIGSELYLLYHLNLKTEWNNEEHYHILWLYQLFWALKTIGWWLDDNMPRSGLFGRNRWIKTTPQTRWKFCPLRNLNRYDMQTYSIIIHSCKPKDTYWRDNIWQLSNLTLIVTA